MHDGTSAGSARSRITRARLPAEQLGGRAAMSQGMGKQSGASRMLFKEDHPFFPLKDREMVERGR